MKKFIFSHLSRALWYWSVYGVKWGEYIIGGLPLITMRCTMFLRTWALYILCIHRVQLSVKFWRFRACYFLSRVWKFERETENLKYGRYWLPFPLLAHNLNWEKAGLSYSEEQNAIWRAVTRVSLQLKKPRPTTVILIWLSFANLWSFEDGGFVHS